MFITYEEVKCAFKKQHKGWKNTIEVICCKSPVSYINVVILFEGILW